MHLGVAAGLDRAVLAPADLPFVQPVPQSERNQHLSKLRAALPAGTIRGGKGRQELWMRKLFARFLADQSGATAIEYCLIAAGISIVIVTVVNGMGTALNGKYSAVSASLK
jgi:pilus assembly protein Flp/PilA